MSKTDLKVVVAELGRILELGSFTSDVSNNGLQVDGAFGGVGKICCGVDATPEFYEESIRRGADMLLVHHGISWGDSLSRITGRNYGLVAPLVKSGIALYAAHLPLDAHPEFGNNACLASAIGLKRLRSHFAYHGCDIGICGEYDEPVLWTEVKDRIRAACPGGRFEHVDAGKKYVRSVGVVSGGAADMYEEAAAAGLDAFVTGEIDLPAYNGVLQSRINFAAAGHYATERFGVKALGDHLAAKFAIECEFVEMGIKY